MGDSDSEDYASADEEVNVSKCERQSILHSDTKIGDKTNILEEKSSVNSGSSHIQSNDLNCGILKEPSEDMTGDKSESHESSHSNWGKWAFSSFISTAQSISTALETSIGIPNPGELASANIGAAALEDSQSASTMDNLISGVSNITKFVEATGSKVICGGLDTLETIGKKTMQVIQDGDTTASILRNPILKGENKTNLSDILQEAREVHAKLDSDTFRTHQSSKKFKYDSLFDDYQGLVHLEALEMLSKQCSFKIEKHSDSEILSHIRELCELPEQVEYNDQVSNETSFIPDSIEKSIAKLDVLLSCDKLSKIWTETETFFNDMEENPLPDEELKEFTTDLLANLTALSMEHFHKCAELLLTKEHRQTTDEVDALIELTTTLSTAVNIVSARSVNILKSTDSSKYSNLNELVANILFEASKSCVHIQNAFKLLIPVIQIGAI